MKFRTEVKSNRAVVAKDRHDNWVRIAVSLASLVAALFSYYHTLPKVTVALLVLASSPWLASFITEITVMGSSLKFRVDENTEDINTIKLLVRTVLTDVELEILARLRVEAPYVVDTGNAILYPGFKSAIDRLRALHFLDEKEKGSYQWFNDANAERDANDFFRVSEDGLGFLETYEKMQGRPINLKELDDLTFGRIS